MTSPAPRPMPFAIMRNAHEAMRASIRLQQKHLEAADLAGFQEEWHAFRRALAVHMAMEDDAMFELLDGVGAGAITSAKLPDEHVEDSRLSDQVEHAANAGDLAALRVTWSAWQEDHMHHLAHEEEVMMPLVLKTASSPEGLARVVHERLLVPGERLPNFDWYIGWVVRMLSEYGSTEQSPSVATRVFAWALQRVCSPVQWARLRPVVESNCSPVIWAELVAQFGLDGEGMIV